MSSKSMTIQCPNRKCKWFGVPVFEECHDPDNVYVRAVCPKCHAFLKLVKRQDIPEDCTVVETNSWWHKIKATESDLRPAYMIQRDLLKSQNDCAALQAENVRLKEIVDEVTSVLRDALEREGLIKHVPKWMEE